MNRDSINALRHDRRLLRRRGWISPEDLAQELASLPDVAHKVQAVAVEEEAPAPAPGDPESPTGF